MNFSPEEVREFTNRGWWGDDTIGSLVERHAAQQSERLAFVDAHGTTTWLDYHSMANRLADALHHLGLGAGDRIGVLLPDGAMVHAVYVACERLGAVVVGLGTRAGDRELAHLLTKTSARAIVTDDRLGGAALHTRLVAMGLPHLELQIDLDDTGHATGRPLSTSEVGRNPERRALGPNDLFLLNSTSGTTGLPKCVTQFQNRWFFFHRLAADSADLRHDDVVMSLVPSPFGFGLWTAHVTPAILGATTVLMDRFDTDRAIRMIAKHHVTILCCVSTQFLMMLASDEFVRLEGGSLRAMFTGGEAVPTAKAEEFEDRTGAAVLQFFGSNETGAFSRTTLRHTRTQRLTTAGELIPEMNVRLYDEHGRALPDDATTGQPGGRGPAMCAGYFDDDRANAALYAQDGSMLMGDYVTIDPDGFLRVVGRKADFIIRGGKNISAAEVEELLCTHPSIAVAAVVPVPDEIFGERVGAIVQPIGDATIDLEAITTHLIGLGASKELIPEMVVTMAEIPRSSGGKIAKGDLRNLVSTLFPAGRSHP